MNLPALIGILVTTGLVLLGILLGSPLVIFLDHVSLLLVVGGTFCVTLATHGTQGVFTYLLGGLTRMLFPGSGGQAPWTKEQCRQAATVARTGGNSAIMMAACGAMIGLTQMFRNMDDPSAIGPAMAVCLLTSFYAILLNLLFFIPLVRFFGEAALKNEA